MAFVTGNGVIMPFSAWIRPFATFATTDATQTAYITVAVDKPYVIDWGDGDIENRTGTGSLETITHTYTMPSPTTFVQQWYMKPYKFSGQYTAECNLYTFRSSGNSLTGSLPIFLDNFIGAAWRHGYTQLESISLYDNSLTGTIPSGTQLPYGLVTCLIYNNQLTGSLPDLNYYEFMTTFRCDTNLLTGAIPTWQHALVTLNCSNNQLSGTIPSFPASSAIVTFNASDNQLTDYTPYATAPPSVMCQNCTTFNVRNNLLTETAVDAIMADLLYGVGARPASGNIYLDGTGNAPLSATGLANKALFLAKRPSWNIYNN